MTIIVVETHFDDAVFSLGEWIASFPADIAVATLCGALPEDEDGMAEVQTRRREHVEAMTIVGVDLIEHGPLVDGKFVPCRTYAELITAGRWLRGLIDQYAPTAVLLPCGIGSHPDHAFCADLDGQFFKGFEFRFGRYEDLPYRVMYPDDRFTGPVLEGPFVENLELKRRAVACYASQLHTEDIERCCFVPERLWWMT